MDDVDYVVLSDISEINPPIDMHRLDDNTFVSFIPMADVSESGEWINQQARPLKDVRNGYTYFQEGDILFAKITPCMENGKGAHAVNLLNGVGFGTTEFHVLRAKSRAHPRFIYHWIMNVELRRKAEAQMTGSAGQRRVPASFLREFKVPFLPLPEQRCIAETLDTVDEAIQKTEALISKLKAMKQGLLHDLLTRGLDENGKLRDPKAHPEQLKDSPLGRIPREWEVVTWGDIVSILTDYTANGSFTALATNVTYLYEGGYARLIRLTDLRQNLLNRDGVYVPQNSYDYLSKSSLFGGEFLLANVGAYAGLVWEMPQLRYRCTLGPNMFLAKFKPECADNVFMIYSASYSFIRQQLDAMASASAQPKLNKTDFRNVIQILPKLNEQKKIVEILESQDMQIISEQKYRDKLKLQKKGLMHDLLTGKVRIKT